MKISIKRIAALLVALLMTISLMAGCAGNGGESSRPEESKQSESSAADSDESKPEEEAWREVSAKVQIPEIMRKDPEYLEWMDDTSPITISVYYNSMAPIVGGEFTWNTAIQQKIVELTGVTVDGKFASDAEGNELTLMIASGEKLPDVIRTINTSSAQYRDLRDGDGIYSVSELIDQYCPLMWELIPEAVANLAKDENGTLWNIPIQALSPLSKDYAFANGWFAVRGDICDDMGIDPFSIETLDDMEEYINYYLDNKENYPEIKYTLMYPALFYKSDGGVGQPFYNSFGGQQSYGGGLGIFYNHDTDSVSYWLEDEAGYKACKYMWQTAQNGWVDESSFAFTNFYEEMQSGSTLVFCGENTWPVSLGFATLQENVPDAYYVRIGMVNDGEHTDAGYSYSMIDLTGACCVITKDCENPERTIKFFEFLESEYGECLTHAGVYGVDWELGESDSGETYCKYIGEASTQEGRKARGVGNSDIDWLVGGYDYDYFASYDPADAQKARGKSFMRFDTYAAATRSVLANEPADSEYSREVKQIGEIVGNYVTQMILAKDEATFEKLYNECLGVIKDNGLEHLKEYVLGLTREYIANMEAGGVVFQ